MEPQLFKISQSVVIQNSEGLVLILRHKSGKWLIPGGKINKGENFLEGLKREIKEETNISNFEIKKIVDFDAWSEDNDGKCVVTFLLELVSDDVVVLSDEHDKYEWVSSMDLHKYEFWHESIVDRINKAIEK